MGRVMVGKEKTWGRVGVLMGGNSSERAISLKSGQAVLHVLQSAGVDAVAVELHDDWVQSLLEAEFDCAFIALHGTWGEDGCVQGMLEMMGIPYTGSGVLASSLCMNKRMSKQLLSQAGVRVPTDIPLQADGPVRYPVFVKPVAEGSSVGLHMLQSQEDWQQLARHDMHDYLVEMPVKGVEIGVSVLDGEALIPVEVQPHSGVYDFASKYTQGATQYFCPPRLPVETMRLCMQEAEKVVRVTGCSGAPRVDMIVEDGGVPVVLEINTIPGMTETSLLPKAAQAAGMSFEDLCMRMLASARVHQRSGG